MNVQCHGVSILHPVTKKIKKIKKHIKDMGKIENLIFFVFKYCYSKFVFIAT